MADINRLRPDAPLPERAAAVVARLRIVQRECGGRDGIPDDEALMREAADVIELLLSKQPNQGILHHQEPFEGEK